MTDFTCLSAEQLLDRYYEWRLYETAYPHTHGGSHPDPQTPAIRAELLRRLAVYDRQQTGEPERPTGFPLDGLGERQGDSH